MESKISRWFSLASAKTMRSCNHQPEVGMVLFKSCLERDSNVNIRFGIFIELRTQGYSVKFFDRKDNFCGM